MILRKLLPYALASTLTGCSQIVYLDRETGLLKEGEIIRVVQYGNIACKINVPSRVYIYYKSLENFE